MEFEIFYDKIKDYGGVLHISIDKSLANYAGFKKGDMVKVMIKKLANKTSRED